MGCAAIFNNCNHIQTNSHEASFQSASVQASVARGRCWSHGAQDPRKQQAAGSQPLPYDGLLQGQAAGWVPRPSASGLLDSYLHAQRILLPRGLQGTQGKDWPRRSPVDDCRQGNRPLRNASLKHIRQSGLPAVDKP